MRTPEVGSTGSWPTCSGRRERSAVTQQPSLVQRPTRSMQQHSVTSSCSTASRYTPSRRFYLFFWGLFLSLAQWTYFSRTLKRLLALPHMSGAASWPGHALTPCVLVRRTDRTRGRCTRRKYAEPRKLRHAVGALGQRWRVPPRGARLPRSALRHRAKRITASQHGVQVGPHA